MNKVELLIEKWELEIEFHELALIKQKCTDNFAKALSHQIHVNLISEIITELKFLNEGIHSEATQE